MDSDGDHDDSSLISYNKLKEEIVLYLKLTLFKETEN